MKNESEYEKLCCFCEFAMPSYRADEVICSKRGVVSSAYKCRKFIYDPLKRIPRMPGKPADFEPINLDD